MSKNSSPNVPYLLFLGTKAQLAYASTLDGYPLRSTSVSGARHEKAKAGGLCADALYAKGAFHRMGRDSCEFGIRAASKLTLPDSHRVRKVVTSYR